MNSKVKFSLISSSTCILSIFVAQFNVAFDDDFAENNDAANLQHDTHVQTFLICEITFHLND